MSLVLTHSSHHTVINTILEFSSRVELTFDRPIKEAAIVCYGGLVWC